jgi:hypothetical protein
VSLEQQDPLVRRDPRVLQERLVRRALLVLLAQLDHKGHLVSLVLQDRKGLPGLRAQLVLPVRKDHLV